MALAFFIGYELIDPVFVRLPALIVGNINPCATVVALEVCDSGVHSACGEIIVITARPWKVGISGGRVIPFLVRRILNFVPLSPPKAK